MGYRLWVNRIHEKICPRILCKDCVIKDNVNKLNFREGVEPCNFYERYPEGYAGGYIDVQGKLKRKMNKTECPREFLWCEDCCRRDSVHCKDYEELKQKHLDRKEYAK